jgi:hypothetical protein
MNLTLTHLNNDRHKCLHIKPQLQPRPPRRRQRTREQYWLTSNTPLDRQSQHRQRCTHGIGTKTSATFAQAVFTGCALGDAEFLARANLTLTFHFLNFHLK